MNYFNQARQTQITRRTNQNPKQINGAKRGKTRASKQRLVGFYFWLAEKVARDFSTNQRAEKQKTKQTKTRITFDT